jgi:hypothetical protein
LIEKTSGSFVVNPKITIYRHINMQIRVGSNCLGNSNDVPLKVGALINLVKVDGESAVLSASVENFINAALDVSAKWTSALSQFEVCGSIDIEIPFSVLYDDQFAVGRKLYYVLRRNVSPTGLFEDWRIEAIDDHEMEGYVNSYNYASRYEVNSSMSENEIFSVFYKAVSGSIDPDLIARAKDKELAKNMSLPELWTANFYAVASSVKKWIDDPSSKPSILKVCSFDANYGKKFRRPPGFKPIEIIGPSTEP